MSPVSRRCGWRSQKRGQGLATNVVLLLGIVAGALLPVVVGSGDDESVVVEPNRCGEYALEFVIAYVSPESSLRSVVDGLGLKGQQASLEELGTTARSLGFATRAVVWQKSSVPVADSSRAAIIPIATENGGVHFVSLAHVSGGKAVRLSAQARLGIDGRLVESMGRRGAVCRGERIGVKFDAAGFIGHWPAVAVGSSVGIIRSGCNWLASKARSDTQET